MRSALFSMVAPLLFCLQTISGGSLFAETAPTRPAVDIEIDELHTPPTLKQNATPIFSTPVDDFVQHLHVNAARKAYQEEEKEDIVEILKNATGQSYHCLLYTSPSPRD